MENVRLDFTQEALGLISEKALARNTGARGLRSILENILLDTMFELPGIDGVNEIMVNAEVVQNNTKPLHIYEKQQKTIVKKA